MNPIEIDLVYFWVDGNDPKWQEKRNAAFSDRHIDGGTPSVRNGDLRSPFHNADLRSPSRNGDLRSPFHNADLQSPSYNCRYENNDELKYSLRSVEKYAPWIRNIFIVTDEQKPNWLNTENQKIIMIDHKDFIPINYLPCFNSNVLDMFIYKIPNLSEHFLLANDDTFLGKPVFPDDFFCEDGFPIIRLLSIKSRLISFGLQHLGLRPQSQYYRFINLATNLVFKKYKKYYFNLPHHNIDAYKKSNIKKNVEITFKQDFINMANNKFRDINDIQRLIHSFVALAEKRGKKRIVNCKESLNISLSNKEAYNIFLKYNPPFFCLNETEVYTKDDIADMINFLEKIFPEKSKYEIQ